MIKPKPTKPKIMKDYGYTICSKHDDIYDKTDKLLDIANELESYINWDYFQKIQEYAEKIKEASTDARKDGEKMEGKLKQRKQEVEDLEKIIKDLEYNLTQTL